MIYVVTATHSAVFHRPKDAVCLWSARRDVGAAEQWPRHSLCGLYSFLYDTFSVCMCCTWRVLESSGSLSSTTDRNESWGQTTLRFGLAMLLLKRQRKILVKYLVNENEGLQALVVQVALNVWIGFLLALCDLDEHGVYSLTLTTTGELYFLSKRAVKAQARRNDFEQRKTSVLDSLQWSLGQKVLCCKPFLSVTKFYSICRLGSAWWQIKWFWSRSWYLLAQYWLSIDTACRWSESLLSGVLWPKNKLWLRCIDRVYLLKG